MITYAIPFYKGRDLLHRALRSVLAQHSPNWRLLVCDDAQDDTVAKVIESFADARIRYARNPGRLGMVGNWNRCLELADTEYVTLLHADDELRPEYTTLFSQAWRQNPQATLLFCRAEVIDEKSQRVFSFPDFYKTLLMPSATKPIALQGEEGLRRLLRGNFLFCPTVCFRKEALRGEKFSPRWQMVQDLDFWARLLQQNSVFVGLPEKAYAYRRHSGNSTVEYTRNLLRFQEEATLYRELGDALAKQGWKKASRTARRGTIIKLNLLYCLVRDLLTLQGRAAFDKASLLFKLWRGKTPAPVR